MRIIYMGTPDFAVPALRKLVEAGHDILLVVTQPDAVRDRGKKVRFSPVKEAALELGLTVAQPERVKGDRRFAEELRGLNADLAVVAAYGQILPKELLDIPKLGFVNIHASLLPKLRGAAPIQRAILDGEEKTGVTIMRVAEGVDTGDMLAKAEVKIDGMTGWQLHDRLSEEGAELLIDTIPGIANSTVIGEKQNEDDATYAPMISKKDGHADFSTGPEHIERMIRAFDPWPGVYAYYGDRMMKLWKADIPGLDTDAPDGTVTGVGENGFDVAAGGRILRISEIQMPGKKRVAVREYLRGNSIEIGTVLR